MQMLVFAWNSVSVEAVVNCFRKGGISSANKDATIAKEDFDLFKDFQDEIDTL